MPPAQKYLILLIGSIAISFLLTLIFFKITLAQQSSGLVSPSQTSSPNSNLSVFRDDTAPGLSLRGNIATHSGQILWQSRVATQAAQVTLPEKIQQGEHLKTGDNGLVWVQFPISTLIISPKSEINFAQSLPLNLVYVQSVGSIEYVQNSQTPISVRALHLLIEQQEVGDILVTINTETNTVMVDVKNGDVTLAYNDTNSISNVLTVGKGKRYIFDDDTRTSVTKLLK